MNNNTGRVEPLPRLEPYNGSDPDEPWYRSDRARLFGVVSGITLILGLLLTLLQPAVYRSSATVLMSAPTAIDAAISEADVQNVAIQRTILLGSEITGRLLGVIREGHGVGLSFADLRELLLVEAVPETNLVEMAAQGDQEEILPTVVNAWIDVYLEIRAEDIARSKDNTVQIVQDEIDGLAVKLEEARDALEQYREDNDILSVERQENEVMARLDGLNKALNTAIEEEVKARANLDTLRAAVRRGENLVPRDQRRDVTALENELQALRAEFMEMEKRYTMAYINKQPRYRAVPERIEELEVELAGIYRQGRQAELGSAEQAHAAARQTVADLQQKLDDHKAGVSAFNRIYATHEALADDLARLEELNREAQARLVQVQVSRVEKYPQVSVIERPGQSAERIGPNYLMLLGGTLLAALGLGVFAVWLQGYLGHRRPQPAYVTLSGVHLYPQEGSGELAYTGQPEPRLDASGAALLSEGDGGGDIPEDDAEDHSHEGKPGQEKSDDPNRW
jgi:uncharacterized protein involved in exopolysaccharide biosynthesis